MMSVDTEMLLVARFLQALGGSVAWVAALTMVRDFFPVRESARIYSLLFLVIGVSPLLAPTIGGFITTALGWRFIFIALASIAILIMGVVYRYLPHGQPPDVSVSLRVKPMTNTFLSVLINPQFFTFALAGAFSFSTLLIYVAGSPIIFMELFHVGPQTYGGIFALLSVGFIGSSQLNIFLTKKFGSDKIFRAALGSQVIATMLFLFLVLNGWVDLYLSVVMFFLCLSCIGLLNPNASALALAPFTRNVGSASALMSFAQIGIGALVSSGVGAFNSPSMVPVVSLMMITCAVAFLIYVVGQRKLGTNIVLGSASAENSMH
jgi:DHA1 family bicyclomycin/chloramphenicol resistance-like MFS transporter